MNGMDCIVHLNVIFQRVKRIVSTQQLDRTKEYRQFVHTAFNLALPVLFVQIKMRKQTNNAPQEIQNNPLLSRS